MRNVLVLFVFTAAALFVLAACEASSGDKDGVATDVAEASDGLVPDVADVAPDAVPEAVDVVPDLAPDVPAPSDVEGTDVAPDAVDVTPPDVIDATPPDPSEVEGDPGPQDQGGEVVDFGFDVRVPQVHSYACDGPMGTVQMNEPDADWICTFDVGDVHGYVYTQATPTGCFVTMGAVPTYTGGSGWISIDGQVSPLDKVGYDWGGNHHNDAISFDWNGKHYSYYHSSFGFGWRACQNADCIQVYAGGGATLEDDGCTTDRTLPAVCSQVKADGTYDALVDTFQKCPGDPNG